MKSQYRKRAKLLAQAIGEIDVIAASNDLAHLHRFVVELKTSLPERLAYENSQILLGGLRVTSVDSMLPYLEKLRTRLSELRDECLKRSR